MNGFESKMKNLMCIIHFELKVYGFVIATLLPKYKEAFYSEVPKWIASGKVKYLEDAKKGLEHTGQAILDLLLGKSMGKSVILVGEDV